MKEMVLLGDEAVALGALHAGLSAAFGYPGTPSTEILEYLIDTYEKSTDASGAKTAPVAQWCANEKTAYEAALGVSFAGKRSVVTMKHVGMNVAADPFMNSSLVSINGGLIVIVADDPYMHSSQGEQDTRFYADFAMVPCFEPTTQQEAYGMMEHAFDLSETFHVPVVLRMVTRLSHSRAVVHVHESSAVRAQNSLQKGNRAEWLLIPALARKNYEKMIGKQEGLTAWSNGVCWNELKLNEKRSDFAIITSGLGRNYFLENSEDFRALCASEGREFPSTLHIGVMPLPRDLILQIAQTAHTLLVIEEGMPFLEKQLRGVLPQKNAVIGKLTGHLPRTGELNPDIVRAALGLSANQTVSDALSVRDPAASSDLGTFCSNLPGRPPQLCKGCPHADSFTSLNSVVSSLAEKAGANNVVVASDIGCYALGAMPPYNAIETVVCMGASIGMARGASQAGVKYAFGVIGDSTFLHSGVTNLIDAVSTKTPLTILILDNDIVAMTGCQTTILPASQLEPLVRGLGVESEHIRVLRAEPLKCEENARIIAEEAEYRGVSVIILVRECLEAFRIRSKKAKVMSAVQTQGGKK